MADELRLDIIVDDHGGVQKLADVDKGVTKVKESARGAVPGMEELNAQFADARARLDALSATLEQTSPRLVSAGTIAGSVAAAGIVLYASALRAAVEDATRFSDAATLLAGDATKFSIVARAASEFGVSWDRVVDIMDQLSDRVASGKIDGGLSRLGFALEQIKSADPSDQLRDIAARIGEIEDPAERAHARLMLLGSDSPAAARLMTQSFAEAAEGAKGMSREAIAAFNSIGEAWESMKAKLANAPATIFGKSFDAFLELRRKLGTSPDEPPAPPPAPQRDLPAGPLDMPDPAYLEAHVRRLEAERQLTEELYRQDEVFRNIAEAQRLVVKLGGDWSDVLNERVATAVDAINDKYVQAVMLNTQLTREATSERDRLMAKLTAVTNPNESEYDRRFNEIDQDVKARLARVQQTGRGEQAGETAAVAENRILEETNLKILELQQNWEGVIAKTTDATAKGEQLKQTYDALNRSFQPPGGLLAPAGTAAPGGFKPHFGPVQDVGGFKPHFGPVQSGASTVTNNYTVHAQGSVFESVEDFVRRVEVRLAELERDRGTRTGR